MPTYEYVCQACGHELEAFQSIMADPLTDCPECSAAELKRKIGAGSALIFKGSGFYCTDYKKPSLDAKVERTKDAAKHVKETSGSSSSSGGSSSSSAGSSSTSGGE